MRTDRGRLIADRLKLKIPVVGPIFLNSAVSRFCRVLGTLLTGGVPIVRSLEISADSTGNRILSALDEIAAQDKARNAAQPPAPDKE